MEILEPDGFFCNLGFYFSDLSDLSDHVYRNAYLPTCRAVVTLRFANDKGRSFFRAACDDSERALLTFDLNVNIIDK